MNSLIEVYCQRKPKYYLRQEWLCDGNLCNVCACREKDKIHVEWVQNLNNVWKELQEYVRKYHTTGLSWNTRGGNAMKNLNTAPPNCGVPPPPPRKDCRQCCSVRQNLPFVVCPTPAHKDNTHSCQPVISLPAFPPSPHERVSPLSSLY